MPNPGSNYTAVQGDSVESVAFETGFVWETVWNAPENEALRQSRKSAHAILPGDVVFIPELRLRTERGVTDQRHRFVRRGVPSRLRIRFLVDDKPRANVTYEFEIDGAMHTGTTDGDGWLNEPTSPVAKSAIVRFKRPKQQKRDDNPDPVPTDTEDEGMLTDEHDADTRTHDAYRFDLRNMDPSNEVSGAKGRLHLLGYGVGTIDGEITTQFSAALRSFQIKSGLAESGELDNATEAELSKLTGG